MYKLSMYQIVCVLSTSFLPLLFWIFPRYAAYQAGADGQWAVLTACLLGLLSAYIHGQLSKMFPKSSGNEMTAEAYGKWLGNLAAIMYVPGYVLFVSVSIYSFSITVNGLLPSTPRLVTCCSLTIVAVVGALYGIEAIARVAAITFPVVIFILSMSFVMVFFRGAWTGVFLHPVSVARSVSVGGSLLPIFFGLNIYLMLNPHFDHRKHNTTWLPMLSVGLVSIYVISVYLVSIRVVGYEGLRVLAHPVDFVLQLVQLQGLIIQRFGVVLIFMSTMFQTVFCAIHLWGLSELTRKTFKLKQSRQKWFVLLYALLVVIVFSVIPNQQVGDWIVLKILVPLSWVYLIGEPGTKLIIGYVRHNVVGTTSTR